MAEKFKFDVVIGNPPYQEDTEGTSDKPIYHEFMEEAYKIADRVLFITPARFLFNIGKTPKRWNEKMLSDTHLKVSYYEQDSSKVFVNTDIKGGIAITYRDVNAVYGEIGTFTTFKELNDILHKVRKHKDFLTIMNSIVLQNKLDLDTLYSDKPSLKNRVGSNGAEKRLTTSIFETLSDIFSEYKNAEHDIEILGLINNKRVHKFISEKYLEKHLNLRKYKVVLPKANGSGAIGEVLSTPLIGEPLIGFTQSFISFGAFETKNEAEHLLKYIKTKFLRVMLGTLKLTQDNNKETWANVPLQDFTDQSDVPWHLTIPEIDQYLYQKYGLSQDEIDFIEEKVKAMD